ncbi:MAG: EVE domain-containing protein [Alphaproteobacteria bacterium]|nr:EVE domain-containing protein [Alphaproteobacteria bacterium]
MAYWLMKSEPETYPWAQLQKDKTTSWDGVRNYQANNNMKAMRVGDQAFFYHSGEEHAIVGIMKIAKAWHPDPKDKTGRFGMVGVAPVRALGPVTLSDIKKDRMLNRMAFVRQSRLSVSPVTADEWNRILKSV